MLWETFKARAQRERSDIQDVFQYDVLPQKLRNQLVQIIEQHFGSPYNKFGNVSEGAKLFKNIVEILRREFGVFALSTASSVVSPTDPQIWWVDLKGMILGSKDVEEVLSAIEITCFAIDKSSRSASFGDGDRNKLATQALEEINTRFRQNAVGFYYVEKRIVRIDSQFMHKEAVLPAIDMLGLAQYEGTRKEFLEAHKAYRNHDSSKAILECAKSFESLMKAICEKRGWAYSSTATASKLIDVCFQNGLIPLFWQAHFSGLRTILESSVTTARNKLAGHGSGTTPTNIPDEMVPYVMHMTASTLLFLAERDASLG